MQVNDDGKGGKPPKKGKKPTGGGGGGGGGEGKEVVTTPDGERWELNDRNGVVSVKHQGTAHILLASAA